MTDFFDAAIIGDGFCSLMTAAHLAPGGMKILVIGKSADWGPGLAYGRCHDQHLLNVPAARMGAFPDDPEDFLRWLQKNISASILPSAFVPRKFYGQYLRSLAQKTLPHVTYIMDEVRDVDFKDDLFSISCGGKKFSCGRLVLATGISTKPDPAFLDPWHTDFSVFKNSAKPVVILGTGLTMVDVVSSLAAQDHKGKITALSRRGLLPQPHATEEKPLNTAEFLPLTGILAEKMHRFRCNAAGSWRAYIDHIRPQIPALWQNLSPREQKIFLKKILPYWNIHRHRQPPEMAALLGRLVQQGQLEIRKGTKIPPAQYIFNCRGADYAMTDDPLLQKLRAKNLLESHENGYGVKVDENLSAAGKAHGKLFVAGSLTAGMFLESTAVPELRGQCAKIAGVISSGYCRTGAAA